MQKTYPVYTMENECQDCYKCVRHCPVKAIKLEQGHASVLPERCVACGMCVTVCPADAKKIRSDIQRVHTLIDSGEQVVVSLAPSWVSEFKHIPAASLVRGIKKLGFYGVSETALGAEIVSRRTSELLKSSSSPLHISTACPAVVEYIKKYMPEFSQVLVPFHSPALTHANMLKDELGEEIHVVFIGPCTAKKREADDNPHLLSAALTFRELWEMFDRQGLRLEDDENNDEEGEPDYVLGRAGKANLYPIENGMIETLGERKEYQYFSISGLHNIDQALRFFEPREADTHLFLELMACEGGCIHGPGKSHDQAGLADRLSVLENVTRTSAVLPRQEWNTRRAVLQSAPVLQTTISEEKLRSALASVGKYKPEDEKNCGGCGYESCRSFAMALLEGRAEPPMCVSFLREQAQKKANALLRTIPAGVVIVDNELKIIECNQRFARMIDEDTLLAYNASPGLGGADLKKVLPFTHYFSAVLNTGKDIRRECISFDERILNLTVFSIEEQQVIGAILEDMTQSEMHRDQIAQKAEQVLEKNLSTVQDIAFRLGENMADMEILLRSIASDYGREKRKATVTDPGEKRS